MQRGLWTNNFFKHGKLCQDTFGTFNLNSHGNDRAEPHLESLHNNAKAAGALSWFYKGQSDHAPILTAIKDLYPEDEMWEKITKCDINREWSASIVQNNGELRAYFCEVAASFDLARKQNHGKPVVEGWWKQNITEFGEQIKKFCPGCGVAAKQKSDKDIEELDTYTRSNADIATVRKNRHVVYLAPNLGTEYTSRVTKYNTLASL